MTTPRTAGLGLALLLIAALLAGCQSKRIAPYAWQEDATDPRLSLRVPAGTPGSVEVPREEQVHPNGRAQILGEVEWPDPRLDCCSEEDKEEYERNELALFVGYTGERGGGGAAVGVGYHRSLRRNFGVAVFGEYVFGDLQVPVFGAGLFFKPSEKSNILVALGLEREDDEWEPLVRLGSYYRLFEVRGVAVSPAAYLDVINGKDPVFVFGLEFGREW